jgi:Ca2+-binding RTX toxin-like protein
LLGGAGIDALFGRGGSDTLERGSDNDFIYGEADNDSLLGGNGDDFLTGDDGRDSVLGGSGNDTVIGSDDGGGGSSDILYGGNGRASVGVCFGFDLLYGGNSADFFELTTAPFAGNQVLLADFTSGSDVLQLDSAAFVGLATGVFDEGAFTAGSVASQADDRIVYNALTGTLAFDADGLGGRGCGNFRLFGRP